MVAGQVRGRRPSIWRSLSVRLVDRAVDDIECIGVKHYDKGRMKGIKIESREGKNQAPKYSICNRTSHLLTALFKQTENKQELTPQKNDFGI